MSPAEQNKQAPADERQDSETTSPPDNASQTEGGESESVATKPEFVHYKGNCHCRKFEFEFDHPEATEVITCNCSICRQKATLYVYPSKERFRFTKGSFDELKSYQFGKKRYEHMFCPACGCAICGTGGNIVAVNLRSVEGVNLDELKMIAHDGASQ